MFKLFPARKLFGVHDVFPGNIDKKKNQALAYWKVYTARSDL